MTDRAVEEIKKMIAEHGYIYLNAFESLAYVLSFSIRECPLRPARDLLAEFGSYTHVLETPIEDLCEINGVTNDAALLLRLLAQIGNRTMCQRDYPRNCAKLTRVGRYLVALYSFESVEIVYVLCLNERSKIIKQLDLGRGVTNSVDISITKIVNAAVKCRAAKVIISHNHPRGKAEPSLDDVATTEAIYKALDAAGIELVDHVIVSGADYYSMEKNCRIPAWEAPSVYSGRV